MLLAGHLQFLPGLTVETIGIDRRDVAPKTLGDLLALRRADKRAIIGISKLRRMTGSSCVNHPLWPSVRPFFIMPSSDLLLPENLLRKCTGRAPKRL